MPLTAGAVIAGIGALGKGIKGLSDIGTGNDLAARNRRPVYQIPDEYTQNKNLAADQAQSGLGSSALDYYTKQADRGLSAGIDATLQAGGSVNNLASLYDQFNMGNSRTAAEDSQLKTQHLNTLIGANKDLAGQKTQQWVLNDYEPYKDKAQLATQLKQSGWNNLFGGLSGMSSALSSYSQADNYQDFMSNQGQKPAMPQPNFSVPQSFDTAPYLTPGGYDYIKSLSKTSPDSPQMQQLLGFIQKSQVA